MELVSQLRDHRSRFPALNNKAYFNFGAQGALPEEALQAIIDAYGFVQREGPFSSRIFKWITDELALTRQFLAGEIGGSHDCFVLTQNVTEGCNIALWGMDWQSGDHILITDSEHPGVAAAVEQISRRQGLNVTFVSLRDLESEQIPNAISHHLQPRTRLVVLSHVLWNTGQVLPLAEILAACRSRSVKVLADGAQSAGVLPLNLTELDPDYYAITGHKWLCGPEGVGALYIKRELLAVLKPTFVGWRSTIFDDDCNARVERFEVATSPFPLLSGLRKALALHSEYGSAQDRHGRITENVRRFRKGLSGIERVHWLTPEDSASGLVSFALDGVSHQAVARELEECRILLRTIPNPDCLRVSLHYLNSEEEIDTLVDALRSLAT